MIDTILVLDTSGSMSGAKLDQLKKAVAEFIGFTKDSGMDDKIAIVCLRVKLILILILKIK